ncbi:ATP-dependent helicase ULS1 [Echria macrotheca]|uniref:ATP-dependent helicase ULS1 n=1 Tax=Echria macrotheca TaxID=438768 RepID=A0AAJ0B4W5_9PEZI|nr:ATP-dependent helicase ULS1 [Echria macrotheca]
MATPAPSAAGRAETDSALNSSRIAELEDELIVLQATLASLDDIVPQTQATRDQINKTTADIRNIRKTLAQARRALTQSVKQEPSSSNSPMADPARAATPSSLRKRSFASSTLGGSSSGRPEVKHFQSSYDSFDPFEDLPDDDQIQEVIGKQKQQAELYRRNKEIADADRAMAESLANGDDTFNWAAQPGGMTSFYQTTPLQTLPVQQMPSRSSSSSRPASNSAASYGWPYTNGFTGALPTIKSEQPRAGSSFGSQIPPAISGQLFKSETRSRQGVKSETRSQQDFKPDPGSQLSFKSEPGHDLMSTPGSSIAGSGLSTWGQDFQPTLPSMSTLSLPQRPAAPSYPQTGSFGLPSAYSQSLASQANGSVYPQAQGYPQYLNPGLNQASASTSYLPSSLSSARPGFLQHGNYYATPLHSFGGPSAPLSSVINQVNGYDFSKMADADGNPLDSRLAGYLNDYVEDPRKTAEEIANLLSNIRPDMEIPLEERGETPEALKYPLYPHQQLALKWMTNMETGTNKGGILADDMGLGKTISSLALMVSRRATDEVKTNLIIGPVALIKQWEMEIQMKVKTSHRMKVYLYHKKRMPYSYLKNYDVVLTTYGHIAAEYRAYVSHTQARQGGDGYEPARDTELQTKCPILHPKSVFYRVILDEAQCIKNKDTQGSKAAHLINATYRWCLTGTPMMNGVTELFPLIRFLRIKPYCNQKKFNETFKGLTPKSKVNEDQKNQSLTKLRAVLKAIMLRRMKSSQIDGKPILELKPKTQLDDHVVFDDEEAKFYRDLESRSQVQFNKFLRQGTVGKNYSNILVLLLRLRQACCHPHLIDYEVVVTNDVSEDAMLALARTLEQAVIERLKAKEDDAFQCPICLDGVDNPTLIVPCGHETCPECFTYLTDNASQRNIQSGNEVAEAKCPVCRGKVNPANVISWMSFKKVHMPEKLPPPDTSLVGNEVEEEETASSSSSDTEADSDTESVGSLRDFVVPDDDGDGNDDEDDADVEAELARAVEARDAKRAKKMDKATRQKQPKPKSLQKKPKEKILPSQLASLRKEANKNNKEVRRKYMHYLRDNWLDSAKVTRVVELLREIQEAGEKTIIFSQWTSLLDLIECQIKYKLRLKYCRYTGGMSREQRDASVEEFSKNPHNTIMLVSLRAGNAGLNLTAASRIIICDPFWNPYIEMQAVDRAHRIGQQREVKVHRVLVKETVEDRILSLQEDKRQLVEAALDEGKSASLGRLSENELRFLFNI